MSRQEKTHVKLRADNSSLRISGKNLFFLEFSGPDGLVTISGPEDELVTLLNSAIDLIEEDSSNRPF